MIQKRTDISLLILAGLILLAGTLFSYYAISSRVNTLKEEKYAETSKEVKNFLEIFINEKKEAISLISFTLARDLNIKNALLHNNANTLELHNFTKKLKEETLLQYIWIQVITSDGKSLYRSWTSKKNDDLSKVRLDVADGIKEPRVLNSISVGKFDLAFKSMVPIYEDDKFIGFVETIAKFNSITLKMQNKDIDTIVLVDKNYKNQLKFPFTKKFIDDYYIANLDSNPSLESFVKSKTVEHFLEAHEYHHAQSINKLIMVYYLNDFNTEPMSYFLLFKDLDKIDFSNIQRIRDRLILLATLALLLLASSFYYLYVKRYKRFVAKINQELEGEVTSKTLELEEKNKNLKHIAHHDSLTELPNRLLFLDRLEQNIKYANRHKTHVSILFLDLDRFKEINDTFGHEAGDKLLKGITKRLRSCVRDYDTIARLGGDEFTIIIEGARNKQLLYIIQKIIREMQKPLEINGNAMHTTFSIGVSSYPDDGDTTEILLRNADTAMYKAKDKGRNTYEFYNESMTEQVLKRVTLETDLREAIENNNFTAYYQPKINALSNQVIGMEALIRWEHKTQGIIPPDEFIPLAEEIGLIGKIDEWMMFETLKTTQKWYQEGIFKGKLSLNVSMKQLEDKNFVNTVKKIISETNFNPEFLELEITESQIMKEPESTVNILNKIKSLGVTISIDDFGTGYSSLSYLKRLPIDRLKIDKSFIQDIPESEDDTAIVQAIIVLAQSLKLEIIAEGVETVEQKDFLVQSGCEYIQGYFYSKPLPEDAYRNFLIQHA